MPFAMTPLTAMLVVWGIVTCVFIGLMIYRSVVGMREEDLMHLDSSVLASQQKEIVAKLDRVAPYTKGFGWASAGMLLLIAGFAVYQAFTRFQSGQ
jgi:hypothetical protein